MDSIIIRFWNKVNKEGPNGCWEWVGKIKVGKEGGYGIFRDMRAHRYSWELFNGLIPDKLIICHKCDNRKCVNPDHLFLGTQFDNMKDMTKKGRRAYGEKVSNYGEKNGFYGKKHSIETRIKMSKPKKRISN